MAYASSGKHESSTRRTLLKKPLDVSKKRIEVSSRICTSTRTSWTSAGDGKFTRSNDAGVPVLVTPEEGAGPQGRCNQEAMPAGGMIPLRLDKLSIFSSFGMAIAVCTLPPGHDPTDLGGWGSGGLRTSLRALYNSQAALLGAGSIARSSLPQLSRNLSSLSSGILLWVSLAGPARTDAEDHPDRVQEEPVVRYFVQPHSAWLIDRV